MSDTVHQDLFPSRNLICQECKDIPKDPVLLPCLHSICKTCLATKYSSTISRDVLTCPECEEDIDKPENGIEGFVSNYFLNNILSIFTAKISRDTRCKICELQGKDNFATLKCLNCGDFLCEDCGKAHNLTRITINHHVQSLNELSDGKCDGEMREKQTIACKYHGDEVIKYYCESCSTPICRECQLESHIGHTCALTSVSQESRRKAIGNMVVNVEQRINVLKKIYNSVDSTLADIDKREKDLTEGVLKTVKKLVDQIEKEKREILQALKATMDEQRSSCETRKRQINAIASVMEGNISFCNDIFHNGKNVEILFLEKTIRHRLLALQAKNINNLTMKWNVPDIRFRNVFLTIDRIGLFELTLSREFTQKVETTIKIGSRHVAGLQLVRRINTTVAREDSSECRPTGLACMSGEHFIVGDQENRKIKIFTRFGQYVEVIANMKPLGLSVCCDVIGATDQMSLNLFSKDKLIKKKIPLESTGSSYPMTTVKEQYFIVVNNKTITFQAFNLHGELCYDIVPVRGSKVRNPVFITSNRKGHIIISDWLSNNVIIMDEEGRTINEYKLKARNGKTEWLPGSLCCDQFDNIFVSDFSRSRIVVLNPQGEFMFEYPTKSDNLDRPRCMTCDGNGYLLLSGKGGYINMYECQYV